MSCDYECRDNDPMGFIIAEICLIGFGIWNIKDADNMQRTRDYSLSNSYGQRSGQYMSEHDMRMDMNGQLISQGQITWTRIIGFLMLLAAVAPVIIVVVVLLKSILSTKHPPFIDYRKIQEQNHIHIISIDEQTDEFLWPNSKYTYDGKRRKCKRHVRKPITFINKNGKTREGTICIDKGIVTITSQRK